MVLQSFVCFVILVCTFLVSLVMCKFALLLASLAWANLGDRDQSASDALDSRDRITSPLTSLALLFLAPNSAAGWQGSAAMHGRVLGNSNPCGNFARLCSRYAYPVMKAESSTNPELLGCSSLAMYRAPLERPAMERVLRAARKLQGSQRRMFKREFREAVDVSNLPEAVAAEAMFDALNVGKGTILDTEDMGEALSRYSGDDLSELESDILRARANFFIIWLGFNLFQTSAYFILFATPVLRNLGVPVFNRLPDGVTTVAENPEILIGIGLAGAIAIALATTLSLQAKTNIPDDF